MENLEKYEKRILGPDQIIKPRTVASALNKKLFKRHMRGLSIIQGRSGRGGAQDLLYEPTTQATQEAEFKVRLGH